MSDGNGTNARPGTSGSGKKRSILPLVVGLPLIALIAAAAIYFTSSGNDTAQTEDPSRDAARDSAQSESPSGGDGDSGDSGGSSEGQDSGGSGDALATPSLGEADAPVVMQEFSDYQ